jgi:hypothetical protein
MLRASMQLVILIFQMDLFNFFSRLLINIFHKNLKIAISKEKKNTARHQIQNLCLKFGN